VRDGKPEALSRAAINGMAKINPGEFIQQVRRETAKVTWPTRKETTVSTIMVFVFVFLTAVFFFFVDQILSAVVKLVLGLGA
jgi:preprotein translocase subunit SecE